MKPEITCAAIGEGNLLLCCLRELLQREMTINTVFTNSECVERLCEEHNIPHHKRNADLENVLKEYETDYFFSISNPRILKEDVLRLPRKLTINYHDSPLPAYAGVHATSWAIMNGEKKHGISWHVVEVGIDTGDILQNAVVDILDDDSAFTLNLKCVEASKEAFRRLADNIMCNNIEHIKQSDVGRTYFGLYAIPKNAGLLKFSDDTNNIYNMARALEFGHHENALGSPKVKTSTGHTFLVTQVEKVSKQPSAVEHLPGQIMEVIDDTAIIATKSEPLAISLAHLHGASIPRCSFREYGIVTGEIFDSSFDINVGDLGAIRKKEAFWRRKHSQYEPTTFYRQKMNVVASMIEVSNQVNVKRTQIELPNDLSIIDSPNDNSMYLQACFIAFLARINCTSSVNVGILVDKKELPNDCKDLYSDIVPGIFHVDHVENVEEVIDKCYSDFKSHKDAKTYLNDMFYRYPELRGHKRNPHHNIVMANLNPDCLSENELQCILQDCNVLILFNGKDRLKVNLMYHDRPAQDFSHVTDILRHFNTFLVSVYHSKQKMLLKHVSLVNQNDKNKFYALPKEKDGLVGSESNISKLIDCQCKLTPLSTAVKTTSSFMTYSKLADEINQLGDKLYDVIDKDNIAKPVIGIHMPNSVAYVLSVLAIAKNRLAFLPLPVDIPADRLCFALKDARVRQILMTKETFENCDFNGMTVRMRPIFKHQIQRETVVLVEFGKETIDNNDEENSERICEENKATFYDENDFLYLMYTSGSTGRPKGVKVRESSVINLARAQIIKWDIVPGDVIAQFASIGFDATVSEIFTALLSGATLAVLGSMERLGGDFVSAMSKMKVSVITLPPSALNIYSPEELHTLKKVVSAGEACTLNVAMKWTSADVRFFNAYGPTEGTVCATVFEYITGTRFEDVNRDLPIGHAIDGVQVYLFDDFMHPVPSGVVGEIYIGGKGLSHGYVGHACRFTKDRFVQNPLTNTRSLLYKTGDHAFQDLDGNITYIGRTDDQVKIRGHRIDLSEIEQVLIQHPQIDMAIVVVHKCYSTNDKSVAAYVAPTFVYLSELREYLENVLPKYMVPTYIKKVEVKDLPKTTNGKIDRKKLEVDESVHKRHEIEGNSHLNDIQLLVARYWCEVFKFEDSFLYSLHRQSSFSELGGNSLQLVLLMRRFEDELGIRLSFTDLGIADTIEEFAEVIKRRRDIQPMTEHNEQKSKQALREMIYHDSELDADIIPSRKRQRSIQIPQFPKFVPREASRKYPQNILLSGVTGFLGAFLLSEILEQSISHVCCMVRESTEARGLGRVIDNMRRYGLWKFEYSPRIAIVLADLSRENLGIAPQIYKSLCNAIDVVFMNAAMMNFNAAYEDHRVANVLGTKEFIKFATTGVQKYLFTTSSLSVFLFPPDRIKNGTLRRTMLESEFFDDPLLIEGGYGQSKWASERLVMQALDFLPGGGIFRPARVSGRSTDGVGPQNDLFASTLIGMQRMGSYPDMDFPYDLTPVDFCAKSMVEVTLQIFGSAESRNTKKVYHLFNNDTIPFRDLFDGMNLKPLSLEDWRKELLDLDKSHKELLPLTPFFMSAFWDRALDWPVFKTSNIDDAISAEAKELLKPSKELLPIYKKFFGL